MQKIEVPCPKCGNSVALTEYGRYLSKEFGKFDHIYEGWCPRCIERVVKHETLSSFQEHKIEKTELKDAN